MDNVRNVNRSKGAAMNTYEYACQCAKDMYAHFPNSITIEAEIAAAAATDQLTFDDFCGLMVDLNVGQGANTLKMDVRGPVSGDSVRNFLSSHAGRIKLINYTCREDADQLVNKIKLVSASIDENTATHKIFDVSTDIRNTQFQETKKITDDFVMKDALALKLNGINYLDVYKNNVLSRIEQDTTLEDSGVKKKQSELYLKF